MVGRGGASEAGADNQVSSRNHSATVARLHSISTLSAL
jgi:hypothetical protein